MNELKVHSAAQPAQDTHNVRPEQPSNSRKRHLPCALQLQFSGISDRLGRLWSRLERYVSGSPLDAPISSLAVFAGTHLAVAAELAEPWWVGERSDGE